MSYNVGESIPFRANASCSDQSYNGPYTYTWTFHDGETATGEYTTYAYDTAGDKTTLVSVYNESTKTTTIATITDTVIENISYWYDYTINDSSMPYPDMSILVEPYNETYNNDLLYATTSSGSIAMIEIPELGENPEWIPTTLDVSSGSSDYMCFTQRGALAMTTCVFTDSSSGSLYYGGFNYYTLDPVTPVLIADGQDYVFSDVKTYYTQGNTNSIITYCATAKSDLAETYHIAEMNGTGVVATGVTNTDSVACLGVTSGGGHTIVSDNGDRTLWSGSGAASVIGGTSLSGDILLSLYEAVQKTIIVISDNGTIEQISSSDGSIVKTGTVDVMGDMSISDLDGALSLYYEDQPYYNWIIVPRHYYGKSYGFITANYHAPSGTLTLSPRYYPVSVASHDDVTLGVVIDPFTVYDDNLGWLSYLDVITTTDLGASTKISRMVTGVNDFL